MNSLLSWALNFLGLDRGVQKVQVQSLYSDCPSSVSHFSRLGLVASLSGKPQKGLLWQIHWYRCHGFFVASDLQIVFFFFFKGKQHENNYCLINALLLEGKVIKTSQSHLVLCLCARFSSMGGVEQICLAEGEFPFVWVTSGEIWDSPAVFGVAFLTLP